MLGKFPSVEVLRGTLLVNREGIMKEIKFLILILGISACAFLLLYLPGTAEMSAMTDNQLEKHFFTTWNFALTTDTVKDITKSSEQNKAGELLEETDEDRLDNYVRDKDTPKVKKQTNSPPRVYQSEEVVDHNSTRSGRELTTYNNDTDYNQHEYEVHVLGPMGN